MNPLFEKMIVEATHLTFGGRLFEATAAIQRMLGGAAPPGGGMPEGADDAAHEGPVHEVVEPTTPHTTRPEDRPAGLRPPPAKGLPPAPFGPATFDSDTYTGSSGTRSYKLFVPAATTGQPRPLVVMLHGCGQTPDDFAAGTRMNEVAQEHGFLVLYPAQAPRSNSSKCWNWFEPADQRRGRGEPDLLAGMTRHIMQTHAVDPARVYVAGLSAGGAMADIMGREYPDLYAAVGVHSGLAQGSAHDVASAFSAMSSGPGAYGMTSAASSPADGASRIGEAGAPAIVFHGDSDTTVHPSNGEHVIGAALGRAGTGSGGTVATSLKWPVAGRSVTRTVHNRRGAAEGEPSVAEHWLVHGGGHAWSGGSAKGSYADARGPDASREMFRFFEEHPLPRA